MQRSLIRIDFRLAEFQQIVDRVTGYFAENCVCILQLWCGVEREEEFHVVVAALIGRDSQETCRFTVNHN